MSVSCKTKPDMGGPVVKKVSQGKRKAISDHMKVLRERLLEGYLNRNKDYNRLDSAHRRSVSGSG
jgi:hypothetical protein